MFFPPIREDRASWVSRVPSQSGHVVNVAARSTNARTCGCSESMSRASIERCILVTTPS